MSNPIGVLDSGLGGLSVVREIKKLLPLESILYYADSKNAPYSKKTEKEIYKLSRKIIEFLLHNDAKIIVIACNTITVVALDRLRKDFPNVPLIGTVPVVKTAAKLTKNKKIGIFSTLKTARSAYQKALISKHTKGLEVLNLGSDDIVPLIEAGNYKGLDPLLKKALKPFKKTKVDVLALGCTHFPLIKDKIKKIMGPDIEIIDSGEAVARQTKKILSRIGFTKEFENKDEFYSSGNKSLLNDQLKKLFS